MPVLQPEQPPVDVAPPAAFPGHPRPEPSVPVVPPGPPTDDPAAGSGRRKDRPASSDTDAIEAWRKAQERTKRRAKVQANQRKARVIQQRGEPDLARITGELSVPVADGRSNRRVAVGSGLALVAAAIALVGYLFTAGDAGSNLTVEANPDGSAAPAGPDLDTGADVAPQTVDQLARSTVQLVGLTDEGQPACAGSGVIVETDGTILTNAHVVTTSPGCEFVTIAVGVTGDTTSPTELLYVAEVLAVDRNLDLAVLRVARPFDDARGELPNEFPAAALGDSDTVELGDSIRILGYPVIGGDTITFTTGSVSGFTSQAGVGNRALIKTDATIAAGNSGGIAIDTDGRIIGIPTKARASESGPAVDCRPLSDTNDDGVIDDGDVCVPVGGFLNGVRPINLARILLEKAKTARPIGPVLLPNDAPSTIDFSEIEFTNPRFSLGKTESNQPVIEVVTAKVGIPEICFFVDWEGVPVGAVWDGVWFIDGMPASDLGFTNVQWTVGESGENFWLCAPGADGEGLEAGVYEVGFFVEGELLFAEGIEITDDDVDVYTIDWLNKTENEVCELAVNPAADSGQTGLNELPAGVSIPPEESRPTEVPAGRVVVEAYDCDGNLVADAYGGIDIEKSTTIVIGLEDQPES